LEPPRTMARLSGRPMRCTGSAPSPRPETAPGAMHQEGSTPTRELEARLRTPCDANVAAAQPRSTLPFGWPQQPGWLARTVRQRRHPHCALAPHARPTGPCSTPFGNPDWLAGLLAGHAGTTALAPRWRMHPHCCGCCHQARRSCTMQRTTGRASAESIPTIGRQTTDDGIVAVEPTV
jgi:hypothetical protein